MSAQASDYRFIGYLEWLRTRGRRTELAKLRRALGKTPGAIPEAYPIVIPYIPEGASDRIERIYFLAASMYAFHPKSWPRMSGDKSAHDLGASIRLAARLEGGGIERRFAGVLACSEQELGIHLRHVVASLKSADVAIDWVQLISDLREWNYEMRPAQRRWARSFWMGTAIAEIARNADKEDD
jgi:CRISPR system Cascade subunit CasB